MIHAAMELLAVVHAGNGGSGGASGSGTSGGSGDDFDPTAWVALALSIVGILVTVFLRYLDGPRVRVKVRPVLFNVGYGGTVTYHGGQWPIPMTHKGTEMKRPDPGEVIELAEIVIENAGRNPMTVYDIGFRWNGKRKNDQWWRQRVRHSSVPTPIRPPHYEGRVYAEGDQFRIEPNDVITILANYWDLVRSHRPSPKGVIALRGSVSVAGRRRPKLSSWKTRWRIPDDAVTAIGTGMTVPLRAVISRSIGLALLYSKAETLGDIYFLSRSLEAALAGVWSDDHKVNRERLKHFEKDSSVHFEFYKDNPSRFILMTTLQQAIDSYKDVIDWSDIAQPGLHKMFSEEARAEEKAAEASAALEAGASKGRSDGFTDSVNEG